VYKYGIDESAMKSPYVDTECFNVDGSSSPVSSDCQRTSSTHVSKRRIRQSTIFHMNTSAQRTLYVPVRFVASVAGRWGDDQEKEGEHMTY